MCVIWGIPYLLIRVAVGEISPSVLVFVRTGLAALILLPIAFTRGGLGVSGRRWPALLAFAAVEVAAPWFFLSSAEQHITSALAGLLISAVPLVSLVIALGLGNRQQMGLTNLSGLLLGLLGVALIVGFNLGASNVTALVEMAVVVVGYSLGPAILARYLTGIPGVTGTFGWYAIVGQARLGGGSVRLHRCRRRGGGGGRHPPQRLHQLRFHRPPDRAARSRRGQLRRGRG